MDTEQNATVESYVAALPPDVQALVAQVRATIRAAVPEVEETISYAIPTFKLRGHSLVHLAAYKTHLGLYPAPLAEPAFKAELAPYASGRATARFNLKQPLPLDLIRRIVLARAEAFAELPPARRNKPAIRPTQSKER